MPFSLAFWSLDALANAEGGSMLTAAAGQWFAQHPSEIIAVTGVSSLAALDLQRLAVPTGGAETYLPMSSQSPGITVLVQRNAAVGLQFADTGGTYMEFTLTGDNNGKGPLRVYANGSVQEASLFAQSSGLAIGGFDYDLKKDADLGQARLLSNNSIRVYQGGTGLGALQQTRPSSAISDFLIAHPSLTVKPQLTLGAFSTWTPGELLTWPIWFKIG